MNSEHQTRVYSIERLDVQNINALAELYTSVYGRSVPKGFFIKKYDTVYTGVSCTGFIAFNKRYMPIAFYGVIPTRIWYEGEVVLAAQSADTMTHPEYRKLGLFTHLAELTYELCLAAGIRFVFGFPNQHSMPGFIQKLNWRMTENMECFIIPVSGGIPLQKLVARVTFLKAAYRSYKKRVLKDKVLPDRGVNNSVLADQYNGVFRDRSYLEYKMYSSTQVIQIDQCRLWIKVNNGLIIGDISGTVTNLEDILDKLAALARKLGIDQIQFHTSPHTTLYTLFADRYKAITSFPVMFKDLGTEMFTSKIKFTFADIDIF